MVRTPHAVGWLAGKQVAFVGRLAWLSRAEAVQLIAAHGGALAERVSDMPTILILGDRGRAPTRDGRGPRKLRQAMRLARKGFDIEIISETEFLAKLDQNAGRMRRVTQRELAHLAQVSPARLNTWLRAGLIREALTVEGVRYFDFFQIASVKNLGEFARGGVSTRSLRQSLARLRQWQSKAPYPLAQLTFSGHGRNLAVRLDNGSLAEPSGQMLLDFWPEPDSATPASLSWASAAHTADQWLSIAGRADRQGSLEEAAHAYRQAMLLTGPTAVVCFNLANVLFALGHYARAGERFRQVLELDADFYEAWNNLGTVLAYEGQNSEALSAYREALRIEPRYADAHYNLADTLEDLARWNEARGHWRAYLELEPYGPWADYARERLQLASARKPDLQNQEN